MTSNFLPSAIRNGVELICAEQIQPLAIAWIWYGWLAIGKFHTLAGAPGTGKTHLALFMAAVVSTGGLGGRCWPDGTFAPKGNVVIWSGEDGIEDTIIPRLIAADADMSRVFIIRGTRENGRPRPFDFAKDLEGLRQEICRIGDVRLVIIDSIVQAVAGDSNKNSEVRRALEPLVEMADNHQFAIIGVTHVTKGSKRKDPLDRVAGSLAFGAVSRVVMVAAKIASGQSNETPASCVLVRVKSNIGPDDGGFEYSNQSVDIQHDRVSISTSCAVWNPMPLEGSGREILKWAESDDEPGKSSAVDEAADFLSQVFANGPLPFTEIETRAIDAHISMAAIKRAKLKLGIRSRRQSGVGQASPSIWHLPVPASVARSFPVNIDRGASHNPGTFVPQGHYPSLSPSRYSAPVDQAAQVEPLAPLAPVDSVDSAGPCAGATDASDLGVQLLQDHLFVRIESLKARKAIQTGSTIPVEPIEPLAPVAFEADAEVDGSILRWCIEQCKQRFVEYKNSSEDGDEDGELDFSDKIPAIARQVLDSAFYDMSDEDTDRMLPIYSRALDDTRWWLG
jgi:hypothetical protein